MQRGAWIAIVVVVASLAGVGLVSADNNEAPLAAAGLDQEVTQGAVVYLDAGGSLDPDGNLTSYEWQITAPNGTTVSPACPSCMRTHFRANQSGEYDVTVIVTDDEGATHSDTLYVTATAVEPPSVSVTGPSTVRNGSTATVGATVTNGENELDRLVWSVNGSTLARQSLSGTTAERTLNYTVSTTGPQTVRARAVDVDGISASATHGLDSQKAPSGNNPSGGPSGDGPSLGPVSGGPNGDQGTDSDTLVRNDPNSDAYYMLMTEGGNLRGSNGDILFTSKKLDKFMSNPGIEPAKYYTNNGQTDAIKITNELAKEDIDKEGGKLGSGFFDSENEYIRTKSGYYDTEKWASTQPMAGWQKTGKTRVIESINKSTKVDKPYLRFAGKKEETSGVTYYAHSARDDDDEKIGTRPITSTEWVSSPNGRNVVNTRERTKYYTWTKTVTEREKVGEKTVTEKRYVEKTRPTFETKEVCTDWMTLFGVRSCIKRSEKRIRTGTETYYELEEQTVTEPVYETTTHTVDKQTRYPPNPLTAENIQVHTPTEYKVEVKTDEIPLWQEVETTYKYDKLEYQWVPGS